jgi:gamma-glutamyltranspeptidase/glutathione hydrolase
MKPTFPFLKLFLFTLILISCTKAPQVKGGVVSAMPYASQVGVDILKKGGNAYDAMVATNFALAVVYPVAGNITGGGFFVYRNADGSSGTLDYREQAPNAAHRDLYLDEAGNVIPNKSTIGGLAVGVPGTVAGTLEIHKKMGSLPLIDLIQPAIDLAEKGYAVTEKQARSFKKYRDLFIEINGPDTFYGQTFETGDILKNPALGKVLRAIASEGVKGFNSGWVADALVRRVQEAGGIITQQDLVQYEAKWRDPLTFNYKDLKVISMGLPSSGGVCLNQMMKMIEPYDIKTMGHNTQKSIQLMVEAERRSYADRSEFLGDPDFVDVPLNIVLDSLYINKKMSSFDWNRATPSSEIKPGDSYYFESDETTHFSIVDDQGNAVAVTTTLNGGYGSKVFVEELGVFMNNEMDDFSSKPGVPNMFGLVGNEANAIEPRKRMLSSMTPTIVEKDGKLYLVIGSPC